jgi:hypothetical protein
VNKYTIIPSSQEYKSAPFVDQEISITLEQQSQQIVEYDRSQSINLAQVFDDERQSSSTFRPTFKVNYLYANTYTGTTQYNPFKNTLYYVEPEQSSVSGLWKGYPQYYEFDFYRPYIDDQHVEYRAKSAYTYNWTYYISYAYSNNYDKKLSYDLNNSSFNWIASEGIPFSIYNGTQNGSNVIRFQCVAPHGLTVGEYVELSFFYNQTNLFQNLKTEWKFASSGRDGGECWVSFHIHFQFQSAVYNRLSELFLQDVIKNMVQAFEDQCRKRYGSMSKS